LIQLKTESPLLYVGIVSIAHVSRIMKCTYQIDQIDVSRRGA